MIRNHPQDYAVLDPCQSPWQRDRYIQVNPSRIDIAGMDDPLVLFLFALSPKCITGAKRLDSVTLFSAYPAASYTQRPWVEIKIISLAVMLT